LLYSTDIFKQKIAQNPYYMDSLIQRL